MARRSRPINADVPLPGAASEAAEVPLPRATPDAAAAAPAAERPEHAPAPAAPEPSPAEARPAPSRGARARRGVPTALKAVGGLVLVALVFLVAAIVGGSGGEGDSIPGAAPAQESTSEATGEPTAEAPPVETSEPGELGYPEFATNNTTRVGGGDPASNAAAVALAVYPSQSPAQRPAAVTFVDAADWETAIAAAALMAEPVRAPLLVSEAGSVPDPTAAAYAELDPAGSKVTGGVAAFAVGAASVPDGASAEAIPQTGPDGAVQIAKLREELAGKPPAHFLVAPTNPAYAMPATAWAARSGDPVLFAGKASLPKSTAATLAAHPGVPVFVLGPSSAISSDVVREAGKRSKSVRRVSGEDPVANAVALARYESGGFGWDVNDPGHGFVVARSDSPLDAAAAAPLSASGTWGPLLLTDDADTLPPALRDYLLDVKPGYTTDPTRAFYNHVWLIGDTDAIGVAQQAEIDELAELTKIGGEP